MDSGVVGFSVAGLSGSVVDVPCRNAVSSGPALLIAVSYTHLTLPTNREV